MRTNENRYGERRRWAGRITAAALLGLLSASAGCRWCGGDSHTDTALDKSRTMPGVARAYSEATTAPAGNAPAKPASAAAVAPATAEITTENDSGLVLTSTQNSDNKGERSRVSGDADAYQVDRTLPSPAAGMDTPALPPPEKVQPVSLAAALYQAGVANPVIAIAQQAIRVSQAQLLQARALLLPDLNVGGSYDLHNGPLQGSIGVIRKTDRQSVYYGMGAYAVAPGTVAIPGLWIDVPLTDALFEPLAARNVVANRRAAAQATNNQILLDVATTYLDLLGAEGHLAVLRQSEADFQEVSRLTKSWAKEKAELLRDADARRAAADLKQLQFEETRVQEDVAVAAANLSRLLNLDPSVRLQTGDVPIQVVEFVDPHEPLPKLLEIAARNRPEMMAAAANIRTSQTRVRQETMRPLLPLLWAGFSAGDFGGGAVAVENPPILNPASVAKGSELPSGHTTPVFGNIASRVDIDVMAIWTLQNFGLGNLAHVKQRRAQLGQAEAERQNVLNQVSLEVSEAYNKSATYFQSILVERRNVQEATEGFQRDLKSILGNVALPIEVLDNCERLAAARQALLAALINFDRAQFQLFVALGQPPNLVVEDDKPPVASMPGEMPIQILPPVNKD
ncbi:MAG: TolC family protein [Gemmataceae bacterium]